MNYFAIQNASSGLVEYHSYPDTYFVVFMALVVSLLMSILVIQFLKR